MKENTLVKKNLFNKLFHTAKENLNLIIIILSICFAIFLCFQMFNLYNSSKIKKNSISFFNFYNAEELSVVEESILELSKEKNFYAILSKLELIDLNFKNKNYEYVLNLYKELLTSEDLNKIYKSAIASKASYQFINTNFIDLSIDYIDEVKNFLSFIDDNLINYKPVKMELNYLIIILELQIKNINYDNSNEAINLYNQIINSEFSSSTIKERVKKIHEFFYYQ